MGMASYHCHPIILLPNKGSNTYEIDQVINLIFPRTLFPFSLVDTLDIHTFL